MSRKYVIGLVIVTVIIAAFYPFCTYVIKGDVGTLEAFKVDLPSYAGPSVNPAFELVTTALPDQDTAMVYRVNNPIVTVDSVRETGVKLGFEGVAGPIDRGTKIAMLDEGKDETRQFSAWIDSGAIEYTILSPDRLYPSYRPVLASEEEARKIAAEFLTQTGLLPSDVASTTLGGIEEAEVVNGGTYEVREKGTGRVVEEEYVTHLLVRFSRQIDGFPAAGPGNKLAVRIGDGGEVISMLKVWREVAPCRPVALRSVKEAFEGLATGGAYYAPLACDRVVVDQVSIAYWFESMDKKQEYVVPVYEFKGKCLDKDGNCIQDFVGWCEAVK